MKSEASKSLLEALKERVSSIFFFNMIISFIYVKWQFVYFTLFDSYLNYKPGEYLSLAKNYLYCNGSMADVILFAFGITISFPIVNGIYKSFKHLVNKGVEWIEIKVIDGNTPASGKEFAEIKLELKGLKKSHETLFAEETKNIERVKSLESELEISLKELSKFRDDYSKLEISKNQLVRDLNILKEKHFEFEKYLSIPEKFLGRTILIFDSLIYEELMRFKEIDIFDYLRKRNDDNMGGFWFNSPFITLSLSINEVYLEKQVLKIQYIQFRKNQNLFIFSSDEKYRFWIEFDLNPLIESDIRPIKISYISEVKNTDDVLKRFTYAYISNQKS